MTTKTKANSKPNVEICNHCGRSVAWGSGWFVNRVGDSNDISTRLANNLNFPEGNFVCVECDSKTADDYKPDTQKIRILKKYWEKWQKLPNLSNT
jgi:hypothetical protein